MPNFVTSTHWCLSIINLCAISWLSDYFSYTNATKDVIYATFGHIYLALKLSHYVNKKHPNVIFVTLFCFVFVS